MGEGVLRRVLVSLRGVAMSIPIGPISSSHMAAPSPQLAAAAPIIAGSRLPGIFDALRRASAEPLRPGSAS